MRKNKLCAVIIALNIICLGALGVYAENETGTPSGDTNLPTEAVTDVTPSDPTDPFATEDPFATVDPNAPTEEPTTDPFATEEPTEEIPTEEMTDESGTESVTMDPADVVEPDNPFGVSNNDVTPHDYKPVDKDAIVEDAEQIRINIKNNGDDVGFGFDKNEASTTDDKSMFSVVIGAVLLFLALGFATFAILFRAPAQPQTQTAEEAEVSDEQEVVAEAAPEAIRPRRERNVEVVDQDYFDGF